MRARETAKLSAKYQISIPQSVRAAKGWSPGQLLAFIPRGTAYCSSPFPRRKASRASLGARRLVITATGTIGSDAPHGYLAWIEWLVDSSLGRRLTNELPSQEQWLVPTIVQHELAKWLMRSVGEDKADRVLAFTFNCIIVDLDTHIAVMAAELCITHKLATADAIVYATAQAYSADLLTCDRHFEGLPAVCFFSKSNS